MGIAHHQDFNAGELWWAVPATAVMADSLATFVCPGDEGVSACREGDDVSARTHLAEAAWKRLTWPQRFAILGTVAAIAGLTIPRLPPGLCFGDAGDLQVASATLGIAHPPGYVGYATLGHLLTRIVCIDPAYVVSLACCGAGIAAIALCMLMQVRLGLSPWIAAATGLLLAAQSRVWTNLVGPEVYAPSLAFLAGAAYLLVKYARLGRRRDLWLGAVLFGVIVANRPPALFAAPFFGAAWWLAHRRWKQTRRVSHATGLIAAALLLLPAVYSAGYVWFRDTPTTPHNAIEHFTPMDVDLPPPAGLRAKVERAVWLAGASPFHSLMGNDWSGVQSKLVWLYRDLKPSSSGALALMLILLLLGLVIAARRCRASGWVLVGMALSSVVFVCFYRLVGQAADVLPLLWVLAVLAGVGLSPLFPRDAGLRRQLVAAVLLVVLGALTVSDVHPRARSSFQRDATAYLTTLNLATFPPDAAVVTSDWDARLPICYAKYVQTGREDVSILSRREWERGGERPAGRPVYFASRADVPDGFRLVPFRNLWRLERK